MNKSRHSERNPRGFQSCAIEAQESAGFRSSQQWTVQQLISLITVSNWVTEHVIFQCVPSLALFHAHEKRYREMAKYSACISMEQDMSIDSFVCLSAFVIMPFISSGCLCCHNRTRLTLQSCLSHLFCFLTGSITTLLTYLPQSDLIVMVPNQAYSLKIVKWKNKNTKMIQSSLDFIYPFWFVSCFWVAHSELWQIICSMLLKIIFFSQSSINDPILTTLRNY